MKNKLRLLCVLACTVSMVPLCVAAEEDIGPAPENYDWWREARFGIFIHWGASSLLDLGAGSWDRDKNDKKLGKNETLDDVPEIIENGKYLEYRAKAKGRVPQTIYDNLHHIFNPTGFDADEWAEVFAQTGAKYITFVAKHHDGFCMFDSKYTDYDIMNTPFARDIAGELYRACSKRGIRVMWYYSLADWYDPRYDVKNPKPYEDYLCNQISELCSNYGDDIMGIWWDGGDIKIDANRVRRGIKELLPHYITNGRGPKASGGLTFGTPEQKLGEFKMDRPWETTITMTGESWFWNGGINLKSANTCLRLLIDCAGGDGNVLLDFGPRADGRIHPPIKERYLAMGRWLKKYGESIYGTRGGPYKPGHWGVSTRKDKKVYLHVTQFWPGGVLELPPMPAKIISCSALTGGNPKFKQTKQGLRIELDKKFHQQPDTVIVLELDQPALDLDPIDVPFPVNLAHGATATASSYTSESTKGAPGTVVESKFETGNVDGHYGEEVTLSKSERGKLDPALLKKMPWLNKERGHVWRYWCAKDEKHPWLEIDLGKAEEISRVSIMEKVNRISSYELQYNDGDTWITFHKAGELGNMSVLLAEPIKAQKVRLQITGYASDEDGQGPMIHIFDVF